MCGNGRSESVVVTVASQQIALCLHPLVQMHVRVADGSKFPISVNVCSDVVKTT